MYVPRLLLLHCGSLKHFLGMTRSRGDSEGGLGLTVICKGNKIISETHTSGGYGTVYCMKLPVDLKGVDATKAANRLVRVTFLKSALILTWQSPLGCSESRLQDKH